MICLHWSPHWRTADRGYRWIGIFSLDSIASSQAVNKSQGRFRDSWENNSADRRWRLAKSCLDTSTISDIQLRDCTYMDWREKREESRDFDPLAEGECCGAHGRWSQRWSCRRLVRRRKRTVVWKAWWWLASEHRPTRGGNANRASLDLAQTDKSSPSVSCPTHNQKLPPTILYTKTRILIYSNLQLCTNFCSTKLVNTKQSNGPISWNQVRREDCLFWFVKFVNQLLFTKI